MLQDATEKYDQARGAGAQEALRKYARLINDYTSQYEELRRRHREWQQATSTKEIEDLMDILTPLHTLLIESIRENGWGEGRPLDELTIKELIQIILSDVD